MTITLFKKKLYEVKNEQGLIEIHYRRIKLDLTKQEIILYEEDYCEIFLYARIIKRIGN